MGYIGIDANTSLIIDYHPSPVKRKNFKCITSPIVSHLQSSIIIIVANIHIANNIYISMRYIGIDANTPLIINYHPSPIKCKNFKCITSSIILYFQSRVFAVISYLHKIATQNPTINCHIIPIDPKIASL